MPLAVHHFDRHFPVVAAIVGEKHVRHPTGADQAFDGVAVRKDRLQAIHDFHVVPSFTPVVRLSADGRQLFVSAWSIAARRSFAGRLWTSTRRLREWSAATAVLNWFDELTATVPR